MAKAPTSYIKTVTAAATRQKDVISFPFDARPQPMTLYWRFQAGDAGDLFGFFFCAAKRRQQQGCQDRNDRDDNKQLYKGKSRASVVSLRLRSSASELPPKVTSFAACARISG